MWTSQANCSQRKGFAQAGELYDSCGRAAQRYFIYYSARPAETRLAQNLVLADMPAMLFQLCQFVIPKKVEQVCFIAFQIEINNMHFFKRIRYNQILFCKKLSIFI